MRFALIAVIGFALGAGPTAGTRAQTVPIQVRELHAAEQKILRKNRYIKRLERAVRFQATRAERNERRLRKARRIFRRSLYASPVGNHWLENAFLCIKQHEGAWGSATGNGFYGGLQFDKQFQRTYGAEFVQAFGWANRWPVSVQMAVAIKAFGSGRGFHPWPNTARMCGLL